MLREKNKQTQSDEAKIQRYVEIQSEMKNVTARKQIPASIKQFQRLKAFNQPEIVVQTPDPPMVYDKNISLSPDEIAVLSKGPKFAVRQSLMKENFKIELEKMICKSKYNQDPVDDEDSSKNSFNSIQDHSSKSSFQQKYDDPVKVSGSQQKSFDQVSSSQEKSFKQVSSSQANLDGPSVLTNERKELPQQTIPDSFVEWEQRKSQVVYDFQNGIVDTTRLKATDYAFNKSTVLPRPQSADLESKHELRKSESLNVFDEVLSTKPNSRFKTPLANRSNLSQAELRGLKSLQTKVSNGSIVICESDKSSKLCVLSKDQYLASGSQHCQKDLKISLTDVKRLQTYVNANVDWLHEIFETGTFWVLLINLAVVEVLVSLILSER